MWHEDSLKMRLAEKGMCFVTNRLSAMTLETDVQRKDIAVQA